MKKLILTSLLLLAVAGCVTTKTAQKQSYVPRFDYLPPSSQAADTNSVTFGLVAAHYADDQPWTGVWPFSQFSENMGLDFQEMLVARGYRVKGPFHTVDEMTYPDKKGCDLILTPTIHVSVQMSELRNEQVITIFGPDQYKMQGVAHLSGRVTLSLEESLTGERMWLKSIELPTSSVAWEGEKKYEYPPSAVDPTDSGIAQSLGPQMEQYYNEVLQTAWNHLDPEEMNAITQQTVELRAKKVY